MDLSKANNHKKLKSSELGIDVEPEGGSLNKGRIETKLYKRRWIILLLFAFYSGSNSFQWIEYGIIGNVISRYYNIDTTTVDWMAMVYMLVYIPFIFPVTWFLDRAGFRATAIVGSSLNAIGALIKVASAQPHLFSVTIVGQTICAVAQVFILGMPSKIAATWFGPKEVSTACSIAVFGNQIGIAIGFLLPPYIVPDVDDNDVISVHLRFMFIGVGVFAAILALLVIIIIPARPAKPPSQAQALYLTSHGNERYMDSVKTLIFSTPSLLLTISYGINTGSFYAIGILLNQEILDSYPGKMAEAGQIGLMMIVSGVAGSILSGIWLDKTRLYKKTTLLIYFSTLLSMGLYSATLKLCYIWIVFVTSALLGFTMTGYLPVGFEFAAEISFPVSEGTSSGLLNAAAQIFGIVFTLCMGRILNEASVLAANMFLCGVLLIGSLLTVAIKADLKRQKANKGASICSALS